MYNKMSRPQLIILNCSKLKMSICCGLNLQFAIFTSMPADLHRQKSYMPVRALFLSLAPSALQNNLPVAVSLN